MEKYIPPFTITNKILQLVSSVSEKVGRLDIQNEWTAKPHLRRNNRIRSIHSSLKIEANSLSLDDVRDVIDGHLVLGKRQEILEVQNAFEAYSLIGSLDPYNLENLKKVHGIMTSQLINESGSFRKGNEGVFSGGVCIFIAPPPQMVPGLMESLFSWMQEARTQIHPLILAAVFHYEFVFIHPFSDGNGRMARLWHTMLLSEWRSIFEYIPLESQIEKFQEDYYAAIEKCHRNGNSTVFIEFMLEKIDQILDELDHQLKRTAPETTEYVKRLLSVMEYDLPYTTNFLMELLQMRSRESFRKHYLAPAMEQGLVAMTIPDKPNSRNQRYVKIRGVKE